MFVILFYECVLCCFHYTKWNFSFERVKLYQLCCLADV